MDKEDIWLPQKLTTCLATSLGLRQQLLTTEGLLQRSLYFKTTHGTKKMGSYIAGGLKIKVI